MQAHAYYLIGLIGIYLGVRFAFRGRGAGSKPRIVNGIAIALIGVAQFFRPIPIVAILLIAVGLAMFIISLFMLKGEFLRK